LGRPSLSRMMQNSTREIRNRLLFLLVRAFVIVLFLLLVFILIAVGYFITASNEPNPNPLPDLLEGYYLGHGSWEGVEEIIAREEGFNNQPFLCLDETYRIILDTRPDSTTQAGSTFQPDSNDLVFDLTHDGKPIGYPVAPVNSLYDRFVIAKVVIYPVGVISFILALFMIVVAILLMRRFVNPLADVIFAAQEMTQGRLNTRIATDKGPQDLRSLSESFNEMASSLERSDRERRDMLADIAHELRTPLSVIRGRLEGVVDGIYSDNGSEVSMALEQTYVLQRLVDDLRLLTLAETRQLAFDKRDVNVANVINRVFEMFSAEAQEKNIALSFHNSTEHLSVVLDPQRVEQVISNLVGNAIRYVPEGGRVWVTATRIKGGVQITVNDNGKGIPAEDLPYVFDRFWRKDKSRSRATGGTGLGLSIAKQLVEAQGGTIEAKNLPEGGLQILIEFKD